MQTVSLCDFVILTLNDSGKVRVKSDDFDLPLNGENIAVKCAEAFLKSIDSDMGVDIFIEKNIPMQAGLGGGSADGAGVLVGLSYLLAPDCTIGQLMKIGAEIGADIPFCICGGTARVQGIGELISPITQLMPCSILIAKPKVGAATKSVFAEYDRRKPKQKSSVDLIENAIKAKDLYSMCKNMFNVLESMINVPQVAEIRDFILENGSCGAVMSGSGTSVVGVFEQQSAANACADRLRAQGYFAEVTLPISHGAKIIFN